MAKINNDLKMEMGVIGFMLTGLSDAKRMATIMDEKWFYSTSNLKIFETIKLKVDDNITPDITLACRWLTELGILADIGGMQYLADCMGQITTPAHIEQYVKELRKMYYDRQILSSSAVMLQEPSAKNMELLRTNCFDRDSANATGITDFSDSMEMIEELCRPREHGLYDIFGGNMEKSEGYLNGMTNGNVFTIGARPGVGKTVISTQMAVAFAERYKGEGVLYFSTEMPKEETLMRILTPMTNIPGWKFRKRVFSEDGEDVRAIVKAAEKLSEMKILVNDKPSPTLDDIRAGVLSTKCKLVIVDYIQRMRMPKTKIRNEALEEIMSGLKNLARDMGCMVIVLSQLDRETDHLTGKGRPQLADLKGSGAIEAESDTVGLMWRYNKKDPHDKKKKMVEEREGIRPVEFIWAKNRHGQSDVSVQLIFDEKFINFRECTKFDGPDSKDKKDEKTSVIDTWNNTGGDGTELD